MKTFTKLTDKLYSTKQRNDNAIANLQKALIPFINFDFSISDLTDGYCIIDIDDVGECDICIPLNKALKIIGNYGILTITDAKNYSI